MRSLPKSPSGIARFQMLQQFPEHVDEHALVRPIVLFVSCGPDRYAYTWTMDGWDVQHVCFRHETASTPVREEERAFVRRCSFCEWERWLTGAECERSRERFDVVTAGMTSPVDLGPQGHGH